MILDCNNPFITFYKTAKEQFKSHQHLPDDIQIVLNSSMWLILKQGADKHWHNLSTTSEIAAFISDKCEDGSCRDIVLAQHLNGDVSFSLEVISHTYGAYTPLHYVLMFPHSDAEWNWSLQYCSSDDSCLFSQRMSE